jgi:hypothetical protein
MATGERSQVMPMKRLFTLLGVGLGLCLLINLIAGVAASNPWAVDAASAECQTPWINWRFLVTRYPLLQISDKPNQPGKRFNRHPLKFLQPFLSPITEARQFCLRAVYSLVPETTDAANTVCPCFFPATYREHEKCATQCPA